MKVPPERRFSEVAGDYARFRPSYPALLIDWIALTARLQPGRSRIADVGCGTGISARLWSARGYAVVGVDPNEAMLEQARRQGAGVEYRKGDSAATGLPAGSVDMVCAAQSYHWFDVDKTQEEFARILRPSGCVCACWNLRARVPLQLEYESILGKFCTDWEDHPRGRQTIEKVLSHPRTAQAGEAQYTSEQPLDREGFFGRVRSASYVAHGLKDPEGFWQEIDVLFDRHQKDGMISFAYDSVALLWKIR